MSKNEVKMGVYTRKTTDDNVQCSFNFTTDLNIIQKINFINRVTSLVLTDNYYTVIKDMIFDFIVIDIFTDVDISEITDSPNSIIMIEDLLENTNIVKIVKGSMVDGLWDELKDAVEKNIEYKTGIHVSPLSIAINKLLGTIEKKINEIDTQSMMDLATKLNSISGELTADKLVEAYSHTDAAIKHQVELENYRKQKAEELDKFRTDVLSKVTKEVK